MTLLAIDTFSGMFPRTPSHLLPDNAAQWCLDCDLAHGDLRGLVDVQNMLVATSNVGSLYVTGGKYAWSTSPGVQFVEGPQPATSAARVYYMTAAAGSQTLWAFLKGDADIGLNQVPLVKAFKVGVPAPTKPPVVTTKDKTTWPLGATSLKVTYWYEHMGTKYQVSSPVTVTTVARSFTLSPAPPARTAAVPASGSTAATTGTPAESVLVVQVDGVDKAGTVVFSMVSDNSSYATTALEVPGGVNATISADGVVKLLFRTYESRGYLLTHVNDLGEESAPSDAVSVNIDAMHIVTVSATAPTNFAGYRALAKYRYYRTAVSTTGVAGFQFLADKTSPTAFDDTTETAALGEPPPGDYYGLPPVGGVCLSYAGTGMLAIGKGNTVYFSEPYLAHAWNPFNYVTLPYTVVNMQDSQAGLVVLTEGGPYLVTGVTPDAMSPYKLPVIQGCLGKLGVADLGDAVAFVSNDGVVITSGGDASLDLSQKFWTRDDWRPSWASYDLRLAYHDGCIYGSYPSTASNSGKPVYGFALRLDDAAGTLTYTNYKMDAVAYAPDQDGMFFSSGKQIYKMSSATNWTRVKEFKWHSKVFVLPKPENFGVMQIVLEADRSGAPPKVTVEVFAEKGPTLAMDKVHTQAFEGIGYHTARLPPGFLARHWSFQIIGSAGIVKQFHVATTGVELGNR